MVFYIIQYLVQCLYSNASYSAELSSHVRDSESFIQYYIIYWMAWLVFEESEAFLDGITSAAARHPAGNIAYNEMNLLFYNHRLLYAYKDRDSGLWVQGPHL